LRNAGILTALGLCALLGAGCSQHYNGERLYWKAQQLQAALSRHLSDATPEQFAEAIGAYQAVVSRTPGTVWAARSQAAIGSLYAVQQEFAKAREAYVLVLQNYGQYHELALMVRVAIAKTHELESEWEQAVKMYQEISSYHPWSRMGMEAPLYIAMLHEKRQEAGKAAQAYERAARQYTKLAPDAPTPEYAIQVKGYLALAYQRLEKWEQAINVLEELSGIPTGVNRPLTLLTLATIYQTKAGHPDKAMALYTKLADEFPEHPFGKVAKAQLDRLRLPDGGELPAGLSGSDALPQAPVVPAVPAPR